MDPGAKQGFVGVDVAYAHHQIGIHDKGLDRAPPGAGAPVEVVAVEAGPAVRVPGAQAEDGPRVARASTERPRSGAGRAYADTDLLGDIDPSDRASRVE